MSNRVDDSKCDVFFPSSLDEIQSRMKIQDKDKIEETLKYCESLLATEEERKKTLESKATTLTGITGLASSVIFGFAGFIFDKIRNINVFLLLSVTILYVILSVYITKSIYYSIMALKPDKYLHPDANEIFSLSDKSIEEVRRERAIDSFYSYVKNIDLNNKKATLLLKAQNYFRNSVIALTIISLMLALCVTVSDLFPTIQRLFFIRK